MSFYKTTKSPVVSIIIPCYNEYDNLMNLLEGIVPLTANFDVEFILVENGSTDDSRKFLQEYVGETLPRIHVVYVDKNRGYGYGIKMGIQKASGAYTGWIHADLQVSISELEKFLDQIDTRQIDVFYKARRKGRSLFDQFFTTGQAVFNSILFHEHLKDVASVPMLVPTSLLKNNFMYLTDDFSIDMYVYVKAVKSGLKPVWIPVQLQPRKAGVSSWNRGIASKFKQSKVIFKNSFKVKELLER